MELLKELIFLIEENSPGALSEILPVGSAERSLVDVIIKDPEHADSGAPPSSYNESASEEDFQKLKENLTGILVECVFNIKALGQEERWRFASRERKELKIAEKLLEQHVYHTAEKIIVHVKSYAEKFQILDLQIACITHLRGISALKGGSKEVELYNVVLKRLNQFLQYEQAAAGFNDLLESRTHYSIGKYRETAVEARQYLSQIREWQKDFSSPLLRLHQYKIELIMYYHANEFKEWGFTLNKLSELLTKNTFLKTDDIIFYFNSEWAKYMRCMANSAEAEKYVAYCLNHSDYNGVKKFEVQLLHFDLKIKSGNYEEAGAILKEVREQPGFVLQEPVMQEIWQLYEAYLYLIFFKTEQHENVIKYTPSFNEGILLSAFSNSFKLIAKDKRGYSLMLQIIRLAFAKPRQRENEAAQLVLYYQQNLKDNSENRTKQAIKTLTKKNKVAEKTLSVETLRSSGNKVQNFDAAELIPFEALIILLSS